MPPNNLEQLRLFLGTRLGVDAAQLKQHIAEFEKELSVAVVVKRVYLNKEKSSGEAEGQQESRQQKEATRDEAVRRGAQAGKEQASPQGEGGAREGGERGEVSEGAEGHGSVQSEAGKASVVSEKAAVVGPTQPKPRKRNSK